jgi:hypothetical protein
MAQPPVKDHFVLSVVAIVATCFAGFWPLPIAIAALLFSLRIPTLCREDRLEEAKSLSRWTVIFGWVAIALSIIVPIILLLVFGGAIVAFLSAIFAAS